MRYPSLHYLLLCSQTFLNVDQFRIQMHRLLQDIDLALNGEMAVGRSGGLELARARVAMAWEAWRLSARLTRMGNVSRPGPCHKKRSGRTISFPFIACLPCSHSSTDAQSLAKGYVENTVAARVCKFHERWPLASHPFKASTFSSLTMLSRMRSADLSVTKECHTRVKTLR
ncbi:hypothetical protein DM01DRAFT_1033472 [Hesseltinella vesiculosa]|uniref:Uncharacterized protein n=1 Tax=Hesseltinella vesiculosa TaxID=101127 RepID=A0A1X2GI40_9FUNG|nr:hypothetical protein DM01DRAFT_1033472 [Hesseltinella vesiculosa]